MKKSDIISSNINPDFGEISILYDNEEYGFRVTFDINISEEIQKETYHTPKFHDIYFDITNIEVFKTDFGDEEEPIQLPNDLLETIKDLVEGEVQDYIDSDYFN